MKARASTISLVLISGILIVSGCSPVMAGLPGGGTVVPAEAPSHAGDPVWVRDEVLIYLAERYPERAPGSDVTWAEENVTEEDLLGSSTVQYTSGGWVVTVTYPIVAPEDIIYEITVSNGTSGLSWRGKVAAEGTVTETLASAPAQGSSETEGEPVQGWIGVIVDLPSGNQFGQYFEGEDGEEYNIGTPTGSVREQVAEARTTGARVKVWGTLYTGVPADDARTIEVERLEFLSQPPLDEGEPVEGWTGVIVDLPPGNQFSQHFEREDGEEYTIGATDDTVRQQMRDVATSGVRIKVWGTLFTGAPAIEARHIHVDRLEVLSEGTQS